ncbi:hypothetical protein [uncultured Endozoicomonas sp.]|uniref:hypothetical protein n=1 Tax=uncultured Endozoicomonas sp. TaxID=432652 RepID=UPI00261FFDFD|nr:hypothetical protein [uncultured Endozoicomonas sp.]
MLLHNLHFHHPWWSYKRLEKFRFKWPGVDASEAIVGSVLNQLLDGYDIQPAKPHPPLEYTTLT